MSEREVVLDQPVMDEQGEALRSAVDRADRAEAELAKLKRMQQADPANRAERNGDQSASHEKEGHSARRPALREIDELSGIDALRQDEMMAYLLDSLAAGEDIGHYGRLVFAMIARHFLTDEEVIGELTKDRDFSEEQAVVMLRQVEGRDYSPPRRERIVEWQQQQEFPILPHPDDPDCGNVYRNLKFPQQIYDHIGAYQEHKQAPAE